MFVWWSVFGEFHRWRWMVRRCRLGLRRFWCNGVGCQKQRSERRRREGQGGVVGVVVGPNNKL